MTDYSNTVNTMRMIARKRLLPFGLLVLFGGLLTSPALAQKSNTPSGKLNYASSTANPILDDGYMVAGELWETIKPMNSDEDNGVEDPNSGGNLLHFLTLGPDGTNWLEPGSHWPGGYDLVQTWRDGRRMVFPAFEADGWGAGRVSAGGSDDRFAFAYYGDGIAGANDPSRNYKRPAVYTDASRTHLVYEAGWPTTIGVDFKLRVHQYTSNDQNMNDFVALEITMTNTGDVDINGDGTVDQTGHDIDAIASATWFEPTIAVRVTQTSGRSNRFGAGRTIGYAGAPDGSGAPFDITYWFPNAPEGRYAGEGEVPPAGTRFIGVNDGAIKEGYTDVWLGQQYLGVKQGSISDTDLSAITANSPDKQTIFGTHSIGTGAQKGWYGSVNYEGALFSFNNEELAFRAATATWYADYGKVSTDMTTANLGPNPAFFSGGTADDVTTFVVGNAGARPNGDIKYARQDLSGSQALARGAQAPVWEDELLASPGDFYNMIGSTYTHTFGQSPINGIGPFGLSVGESMTMVFVSLGGYRFNGLSGGSQAAEWAWENGWDVSGSLPTPPAPEIRVSSTTNGTSFIQWTDVTGIDSDVDGYKIWRAAQFQRTNWLDEGFRIVDNYQQQHEVGERPSSVFEDVNPYFDAASEFTGDIQGTYQPSEWGPYKLIAKIPVSEVSQYNNSADGYDFAYEDADAITGFTYWYYVSAYKDGNFTGPQGAITGHIESSNFNRNGRNAPTAANAELASGTPWSGTYGYTIRNVDFPANGTQGYKNIGAPFTVTPPVAPDDQVADLITVTPNPYKVTGLNDVRTNASSHNIDFLNMPSDYTLTIVDVSGQIIYQTEVTNAADGKFTWDLFSKDGVEVASGVYVYHVAYGDRETTGHFAILR
ncbi:MAG: T9SS type A sorting domain-containing protein [Bacteroidetes bacterium]|nr:T9SS type A sorting domain-containing protein [Bacteroidota bacterium]